MSRMFGMASSRLGVGAAILTLTLAASPRAQQPPQAQARRAACDDGVVQLPANITGRITVCSALAAQIPALARQLDAITQAFGAQQQQIAELTRLMRAVNGVSQNIGADRQAELLRNLFSQLQVSQRVGAEQAQRQMTVLADDFDRLRDLMLRALSNVESGPRVNAAADGPLGDSIAQLDFPEAEKQLADIRAELAKIGSQVEKVAQNTADIKAAIDLQRFELPRVANAVSAADTRALRDLLSARVPMNVLEEALRAKREGDGTTAAIRFFENTTGSTEGIAWLDAALDAGLDPNLTVPGTYYEREGLLIAALRAGNAEAAKVLLRRGASPHAYQDLFLTRYPDTRFILPLASVAADDRLNQADRTSLTQAFLDAGLVIPALLPPKDMTGWPSVMYGVRRLHEEVLPRLGVKPTGTAPPVPSSPGCTSSRRRTGEDWCQAIAAIPRRLLVEAGPGTTGACTAGGVHCLDFDLRYLLAVDRTKAYFLGLTVYQSWDYVLVEAQKDGSSLAVLRFMPPGAGMGLCKAEEGVRPDYCWRRLTMQRVAGANKMRADSLDITWTIVSDSTPIRPPR